MKIGILTFSKSPSYGATLQCYALCKIVRDLGHTPFLIKNKLPHESNLKYQIRFLISCRNFISFKKKFFPRFINTISGLDLVIVGSDQVWNPDLTGTNSLCFFGDYPQVHIPFIAYAASFGRNVWEHDELETRVSNLLHNHFKAISVREKSGIEICQKTFGVNASFVLDPTLLVGCFDELAINIKISNGFASFKLHEPLDFNWQKMLTMVANRTNSPHTELSCIPNNKFYTVTSVENWLSVIASSHFLLTDSFHGMLMAIKYHKPFIVFRPISGREGRVKEFLEMLHLEDRYCADFTENKYNLIIDKLNKKIDYETVEKQMSVLRSQSMDFLKKSITL